MAGWAPYHPAYYDSCYYYGNPGFTQYHNTGAQLSPGTLSGPHQSIIIRRLTIATFTDAGTATDLDEDSSIHSADYEPIKRYSYCLKIFNPNKRSKFIVEKLRRYEKFKSPNQLRECLLAEYGHLICDNDDEFQIGFSKGKQGGAKVWIKDEKDLECMYRMYGQDQEITLWCERHQVQNTVKWKRDASVSDLSKPASK